MIEGKIYDGNKINSDDDEKFSSKRWWKIQQVVALKENVATSGDDKIDGCNIKDCNNDDNTYNGGNDSRSLWNHDASTRAMAACECGNTRDKRRQPWKEEMATKSVETLLVVAKVKWIESKSRELGNVESLEPRFDI